MSTIKLNAGGHGGGEPCDELESNPEESRNTASRLTLQEMRTCVFREFARDIKVIAIKMRQFNFYH